MTPSPRERWERQRKLGFWRFTALYGSAWFWLTLMLWSLFQCLEGLCAQVVAVFTVRLPYTLIAWVVGATLFGGAMWYITDFIYRRGPRA